LNKQALSIKLAVYISGHGFGHLAQVAPVLNALYRLNPGCHFLIRCPLPAAEIRARLDFDFQLDQESVDIGVVQKSAIEEDRGQSIAGIRYWLATMKSRIQREVVLLREYGATAVLSDISPLAFPAAQELSIPSIGLATLDWHTIYSAWLAADDPVLEVLSAAYRHCGLLLTPPMAMTMPLFPRQQQVPLIAATPEPLRFTPPEVDGSIALVIFGGSGKPAFDLEALSAIEGWHFLIPGAGGNLPGNVRDICFGPGLRAVDVMPHVDTVVCKPGYGILSECWRTKTAITWVERPDFPEFPMLKMWLDERFPSAGMSRSDFSTARWGDALEASCSSSRRFPDIDGDGAEVAASMILAEIG